MPDPTAVNSMFGRIAPRYDLANRLLSGGADVGWRRCLVSAVRLRRPKNVLDLATGSGDVAFALSRALPVETRILGMDFCQPMLDQAARKRAAAGLTTFPNLSFQQGDVMALPLPDEAFDTITIAFGLRNLADRNRGLQEIQRVLRPGGRLYVLEFSQPKRWFRPVYFFYLKRILPALAGWITGDRAAYVYLNDTIASFPGREALSAEIMAAGFASVDATALTLGTVALHEAVKQERARDGSRHFVS